MKVDFLEKFKLKIFKCRNVKTPQKAWEAAGWDFFIPEDLHISDFVKSYKNYLDESTILSCAVRNSWLYKIPVVFKVKSNIENGLYVNLALEDILTEEGGMKFKFTMKNSFNLFVVLDDNEYLDLTDEIKNMEIEEIIMMKSSKILIPAGIHVNLPENVFLNAANKSGVASKRGLLVGASLIDSDYCGEVHIQLNNPSDKAVVLKAGEKIIQFVPYFQPQMSETEEFESVEKLYENKNSERGAGGFGSSGIK